MPDVSKTVAKARGVVYVSHHQWYLKDEKAMPKPPFAPSNELVITQRGVAVIFTGISSGPVNVEVEVRREPPAQVSTDGWEEVVETMLEATVGRVRITGLMADPPVAFPVLTADGPGPYRIRVHARGRDTAPDLAVSDPVEDYLLVIWPARPEPEIVYKQTDTYGAMLRWAPADPQTPTGF
jgi:hypothetical protein